MVEIIFSKLAEKSFQSLYSTNRTIFSYIDKALDNIKQDPKAGIELTGLLEGRRSYSVGNNKIIYELKGNQILIHLLDLQIAEEKPETKRRVHMRPRTVNDVLKFVKENKIKFIKLWFTDVLGFLKGLSITDDELEKAMKEGMGFDGSSIEGFARIEESDMVAMPDPTTFEIIPTESDDIPNARMFCDIYDTKGNPYTGDPRYILKKALKKAEDMGYKIFIGPELEYFYFKNSKSTELQDKGGYFDLAPLDSADNIRNRTILTLKEMGIDVEYSHHEVSPSQHEIDLKYNEALKMADTVMTYRLVVKETAQKHGLYATFMPKPAYGINGSGMHVHMSLFEKGKDKNTFFDPDDKYHLSDIGKKFIAGLMKHAREITVITNQWINSYKRLVPGFEAPIYVCWAHMNRSALIRVPGIKPGKEKAARLEYRSPDPACNPYLAFAVMIAAGLKGIEEGYKLGEPAKDNIYHMGEEGRKKAGIDSLPEDLLEAIKLAETSELVKDTLGKELFYYFIRNKRMEWDEYKQQLSQYEINKYLPIL